MAEEVKLGDVYTIEGESSRRTSLVVWTSNGAYASIPMTAYMQKASEYIGKWVLFLWVAWYHISRLARRLWAELRYDQWGGVRKGFW